LLFKVNNAEGDLERLREEKDQEILVLDESMTDTIQRLQEAQQVITFASRHLLQSLTTFRRRSKTLAGRMTPRSTP
jgi:hypothetical protein